MSRYSDLVSKAAREMGRYVPNVANSGVHVKPEQVLVTLGAAGMLSLLCQALLTPGLNAVTSERSFIVYRMAVHATGARLIETPSRDHDLISRRSETRSTPTRGLCLLANPNNPTGTMIEAAEVERFIAKVPQHVVVVLDETYFEFAEKFAALRQVEYSRALEYVRKDSNMVVLRTFSKVDMAE
jgi:histidinol-phosphate aminotransferase